MKALRTSADGLKMTHAGTVFECTEARARELIKRGIAQEHTPDDKAAPVQHNKADPAHHNKAAGKAARAG